MCRILSKVLGSKQRPGECCLLGSIEESKQLIARDFLLIRRALAVLDAESTDPGTSIARHVLRDITKDWLC
jgi:hypothetical protein